MNVEKGAVYGLVGPNGAGKSTLIRHITGVMRQDAGEVDVYKRQCMYRIGGRRRRMDASLSGVAVGIPPLWCWISNLRP